MKDIWNEAALRQDRPFIAREYIYASEMSKPLIDIYLSMKGTQPTNLPNMRSRRKFLMGNLIEELQGIIISTLGLRVDLQQVVQTNGLIPVRGKIDFLIQGIPNYEQARIKIRSLGFSAECIDYLLSVIDKFEAKIGNKEFAPMIRECKSCSHFVIEKIGGGGSIIGHKLQLYHYLKGLNIPLGYVDYLSKDDSMMEECRVQYPDNDLGREYDGKLFTLKEHLDGNIEPPKLPLIAFEDGRFTKQFGIEYSNFLTLIYGFDEPQNYSDSVKGKIGRWNTVLKRIKRIEDGECTPPSKKFPEGQKIKLTDKNQLAIEEMNKEGFDPYALAKIAVVPEEAEEELV